MIRDRLESLIKEAMFEKDNVKTETYRAIKNSILRWTTAKDNVGKTYDEAVEIQLLRKLSLEYDDTATMCDDGKHDELVADARRSAELIREFLPAPVTEETIKTTFDKVLKDNNLEPIKKNMGTIIKAIKSILPAADGKMISQVVGKNLN